MLKGINYYKEKAEKDIERKVKQKEEEVLKIREQLIRAEAYLEALQESLRLIQRTSSTSGGFGLRPGSLIDKVRKVLLESGKPMHVGELLQSIGKEVNKKNRSSLSGSLGSYVRQGYIFTRPAPNTFGLKEFNNLENDEELDIPDGFGTG